MSEQPGAPETVLIDPDQGEGAGCLPFVLAQRGLLGLKGYEAAQLRLRCSYCEAEWKQPADQPIPMRHEEHAMQVECPRCRRARHLIDPAVPDPPGTFRILTDQGDLLTDPDTGDNLIFLAANYTKGRMGALHQAARKAGVLQRANETVQLVGDGERRRYAPEYLQAKGAKRWPYRVACVNNARCGNWVHPASEGEGGQCRACYAASETAQENGRRATRQRLEKEDAAE